MIGTDLGPYRIVSELGRGGMGRVWLAEVVRSSAGLDPGDRVALKVLHPHLLETEGFFKRFLLEAEIGKSVRHENLVRTLDVDALLHEGSQVNFLVMEYVEGQTLRNLLDELGRVPEELCRHVAKEAASALAAIHEAGVVHRDLKPDNVLVTKDHEVKIMDLGVARLVDEAIRLSQTGAFLGSLHYAAPEQFRGGGDSVDARADLYSLGLVLYELAAGENPYDHADYQVVLRRALNEEPARLGDLNPQVSPFFEEVVHTLLAKDPEQRFGAAAELLRVLEEGERSEWWTSRASEIRARTRRPLRRVRVPRETEVYGREDELAGLRALYEKAKAADGQVVLIEGEAGIGKTRLVDELVAGLRADGEDLNFLFGSYPPCGAATAAGAWSTAYREQFGEDALEETLADYLQRTPVLVPAFAALLRGGAPPEGAPPLSGDSLQTVFVHATRALAEERPTIVLIDDLHFAPEGGRSLFTSLALSLAGHRVMLIGTSRRGLPETWIGELDRLEHVMRLPLDRLGPKDLAKLLVEAFRSVRLAEELTFQIATKSDGNPFFVFEIIQGLREENLVTRREDGTWETAQRIREIQIPSSVRELIRARVAELDDDERDLLEVASCCGYEFDPSLVARATGAPVLPTLKRFAHIEYEHRLIRSAGRRYRFDHHQVQEALHGGLFDQLREQYHAALGDALESRERRAGGRAGEPDAAESVELCEHFFKGASPERALPYLERALDHLEEGYLHDAAVELADRALEAPGLFEGEERVALLLRKEKRLNQLGRREAQRATLDEALSIAGETAPLLARLGRLLQDLAEREESDAVLRRAIELAVESGDERVEARARRSLGHNLRAQGRVEEGLREYERTMEIARSLGDEREEAYAAGSLGLAMNDLGRYEESLEWQRKDLEMARRHEDRQSEAMCLGNIGNVLEHLGRLEEARDHQERSLTISCETGYRRAECIASFSLANILHSLGDGNQALALYERCLALAEEIDYRLALSAAPGNIALIHRGEGRLAEAIAHSTRQLDSAREIGYRQGEAIALLNLGSLSGLLGDTAKAREMALDAVEITRDIGFRRVESYALDSLASACEQEGELDAAREHHAEAIALRRDMKYAIGLAISLASLGRLEARAGRDAEARPSLEEARTLAADHDAREPLVLATCYLATLSGGDAAAAQRCWEAHGSRLDHLARMEARFALWRATGDSGHLEEAHRLLEHLVEHAPEDCRETVIANVPLHRDITAAWEETWE
ncbi:MAG: serine/threonine-protein kinase [Planctomycetota bacterium]